MRTTANSNHTDDKGALCFCCTLSPMPKPMKKMGTLLQNISKCPTALWIGATHCTATHHTTITTGNQRYVVSRLIRFI